MSEKAIRTHILFPEGLAKDLRRLIGRGRRSQFVSEATRERLRRVKLGLALEGAAGAWGDKEHPDLKTSDDIEVWIREIRGRDNKRLRELKIG